MIRLVHLQIGQGVALEYGTRFDRLQRQRAVLMAQTAERLRGAILQSEHLIEPADVDNVGRRRRAALEPGADGVVRELRVVAHGRAIDRRASDGAVGFHEHLDDDREPVLLLVE